MTIWKSSWNQMSETSESETAIEIKTTLINQLWAAQFQNLANSKFAQNIILMNTFLFQPPFSI